MATLQTVPDLAAAYIVRASTTAASLQPTDPFEAMYDGGIVRPYLPLDYLLVLTETCAIHAACVKAAADDTAGGGWQIETDDDSAQLEDEIAGQLDQLTPDGTFQELLTQAAWERQALGWAAWEIVRGGPGDAIQAVFPLPGHTLRATRNRDVFVAFRGSAKTYFRRYGADEIDYRTGKRRSGRRGDYRASEVLVFRSYTPRSPWYGLPAWAAAIPAIAELAAIRDFNVRWHKSGGKVDRIVHATGADFAGAKALIDGIRDTYIEQKDGDGHVTLFTAAQPGVELRVDFLSPDVGRRDGQFRQQRAELLREVLMAHQMPPYRIGWAEQGSLGGTAAENMLAAYRTGVVEPSQGLLEDRLDQTLFADGGIDLRGGRFRLRDFQWSSAELDVAQVTAGVDRGVLTPAQGAVLLGQTPPGEDEAPELHRYYVSGTFTPLSDVAGVTQAADVVREFKSALQEVVKTEAQEPPQRPGGSYDPADPAGGRHGGNGDGSGASG